MSLRVQHLTLRCIMILERVRSTHTEFVNSCMPFKGSLTSPAALSATAFKLILMHAMSMIRKDSLKMRATVISTWSRVQHHYLTTASVSGSLVNNEQSQLLVTFVSVVVAMCHAFFYKIALAHNLNNASVESDDVVCDTLSSLANVRWADLV